MEFFLVSTDHLSDRLWFRDDNDYKAGMNLVAAVASLTGVNVLAFILMSNHVHFVLECSESKARLFINQFKKYHGQYLSNINTQLGVRWRLDKRNTLAFSYRFNYSNERDIDISKSAKNIRLWQEKGYGHIFAINYEFDW